MQQGLIADPDTVENSSAARLRPTFFIAIDYAINVLILLGFASAEEISYGVPLWILLIALLVNAGFVISIASGTTKHLRDPSLIAAQIFTACGINLLMILLAPQVAYMAVLNLFVLLSYGSVHFTQRTFLFAWFFLSCILGIELRLVGSDIDIATATQTQRWLFWLVLALALGRFLAINAEVSRLRLRLQERNQKLSMMAARLGDLASRDELTKLWNRREFMRLLQEERKRISRRGGSFCVALIDADHFKQVNDRFGHLVGDAVLQELAQVFDRARRMTDTLARYGGEEFVLLLHDANAETARHALERMRIAVEQHDWEQVAPGLRVTVSAGVAESLPTDEINQTIDRADRALYEAKHAGRNRVMIGES